MSDQGAADELFGDEQRREVDQQRALARVLADLDDRVRRLGTQVQSVQSRMEPLPEVATSVADVRAAVGRLADRPTVDPTGDLRDDLGRVMERLAGIERQTAVPPQPGVSGQDLDALERRLVELVESTLGDRLVDVQRRLIELDEDVRHRTGHDALDAVTRVDLQQALRREQGVTAADLDALRQSIEAVVRSRADEDSSREAIEELRRDVQDTNDRMLARIDATPAPVASDSDALREEISQLRTLVEDLGNAAPASGTGADQAMRQRLDLLGSALNELEVGRAAGDAAMQAAFETMNARLEAVASSEDATRSTIATLDARLQDVATSVDVSTRAVLDDVQDQVQTVVDADRSSRETLEALQGQLAAVTEGDESTRASIMALDIRLQDATTEVEASTRAALSGVEERLQGLVAGVDEMRSRTNEVGAVLDQRTGDQLDARVRNVVEVVVNDAISPTRDEARHLTALVDGIAASLDAETSALRDQSAAVRSAIAESIAEQRDDAALAQLGLVERLEATLTEHRRDLAEMDERVGQATAGVTEVATGIASQMRDVRDELETARDADRIRLTESLDEVRSLVDASETRTGSFAADLQDSLTERQRDHQATVAELRALLEAQATQVQHALTRSEGSIDGRLEEFQTVSERQVATTTETVGSMFDGRLAQLQEELARTRQEDERRQEQVVAQVTELSDRLSSLAGDQLSTGIDDIRTLVARTEETLRGVSSTNERQLVQAVGDLGALVGAASAQSSEQIATAVEDLRSPVLASQSNLTEEIAAAISELRGSLMSTSQVVVEQLESVQTVVAQSHTDSEERVVSLLQQTREMTDAAQDGALDRMTSLVDGVRAVVAAASTTSGEQVAGLVDELREAQSQSAAEEREARVAVMDDLRELVRASSETQANQLDETVQELQRVLAVTDDTQSERLATTVEILTAAREEAAGVSAALTDSLAGIEERGVRTDRQLQTAVGEIGALVADAQARLDATAETFAAEAGASLAGATEEVVTSLRTEFRVDDEARAEELRATVQLLIDSSDQRDNDLADGVASSVTSLRASVQALQEDVTGSLTQSRSSLQSALAAQAGRIQQLLDTAAGRLDEAGRRVADQGEAMVGATASLEEPLATLRAATDESATQIERLATASSEQEQSVRGLLDDLAAMRGRLDTELDRLAERTAGTIAAATAALAEERAQSESSLRAIVTESGNDLTRAQVALTRGSDAMLAAAGAQEERTIELRQATQDAMQEAADRVAATFETRVNAAWHEASASYEEQSRAALDALRDRLVDLQEEAVERQDGLETMLSTKAQDLVSLLTTDLRRAEHTVTSAAQGLQTLEQVFVDYLARRDAQLATDRQALASDLVGQLADGLSDRQRRRLAARVEPADPGAPVPGAGDTIRDLLEQQDDGRLERAEAEPPAPPTPSAGEASPTPPTGESSPQEVVKKSTARSRATARSVPDAAAERERLAAVVGLGPAKADRLLEIFGDVAGVEAASDDDLLAVSGIGPAVLQAIRSELV